MKAGGVLEGVVLVPVSGNDVRLQLNVVEVGVATERGPLLHQLENVDHRFLLL